MSGHPIDGLRDRERTSLNLGEKLCPCGRAVENPDRGWWSRLGHYVALPLVTLAIYALVVAVGVALMGDMPAIGWVVMLIPLFSLLGTFAAMVGHGHRGWCLLRRSLGRWLWWPGMLATVFASF
jgi:hypothetical protein